MNQIPIGYSFFRFLRAITLFFFCFWLVLIIFDTFLYNDSHKLSQFGNDDGNKKYLCPNGTRCDKPDVSSSSSSSSEINITQYTQLYTPVQEYVQLSLDQVQNYHIILFWTPYFEKDPLDTEPTSMLNTLFDIKSIQKLKRPKQCYQKFPKCLVTSNRAYLKHSSALIFHWRDFRRKDLPFTRNPDQLWTLYNLESPSNSKLLPENSDKAVFNLTATYRHDSDLFIPYGMVNRRTVPLPDSHSSLKVDLSHKSKPIAWFVSNCKTQSHREDYVQQLSRFIQVDIFGKCGNLKCDPSHLVECYREAAKKYLFYLSFENSFCKDYVTEKLFYILSYDMVPIVYGSANYSSILPPNSYIDASTISSGKLAKLLVSITKDRTKYLSYFAWRQYYVVEKDGGYNELLFCELCQRMALQQNNHSQSNKQIDINRKWPKWSSDYSYTTKEINSWYFDGTCNTTKPSLLIGGQS